LTAKPGTYGQGAGLYLKVRETGQRSWEYRYKSLRTNRYTTITIGSAVSYTIDEARWKIAEWRTLKARENQDPLTSKRIQRASGITFDQVCDEWIATNLNNHPAHPGWSPSQIKDANLRLKIHGKSLAGKGIAQINIDTIDEALRPLARKAPPQARRTISMWKRLFSYAKHKKYFTGDNPCEWADNLEHRFPFLKQLKTKHHPSMPYEELPAFLKRLRVR
jgi:hypothetical protein